MSSIDSKIEELLIDLKEHHCITSLKAEFEAEGASFDEVLLLKQYADSVGLDLTLKVGGCEAVRDLRDAKKIGANVIVAPMIESAYALKKFISAVSNIYTDEVWPELLINIETITGINNIDEIITSEDFLKISGIVIGRTDLVGSLGLSSLDSDINVIFEFSQRVSDLMKSMNKKMIIGGSISDNSLNFLKDLSYLSNLETRKVVFTPSILHNGGFTDGINKALRFEILWLENKISSSPLPNSYDLERLRVLNKRYNCFVNKI